MAADPVAQKLIEASQVHSWNRSTTARSLGIGRNTPWRRMREHGPVPAKAGRAAAGRSKERGARSGGSDLPERREFDRGERDR